MKALLAALIFVVFIGLFIDACNAPNTTSESHADRWKTVKIDGCEYLYDGWGDGNEALTHKGNCSNPNHTFR